MAWAAQRIGDSVELRGERWGEIFPLARLPGKIAFYKGLAERCSKRKISAPSYTAVISALESINAKP